MSRRVSDDQGASLIEVLVAVVVLGTAGLALLGSMFTSIAVSDVHRKEATAGVVARDYSERIAGAPDLGCASAAGAYGSFGPHVGLSPRFTTRGGPVGWGSRARRGGGLPPQRLEGGPPGRVGGGGRGG